MIKNGKKLFAVAIAVLMAVTILVACAPAQQAPASEAPKSEAPTSEAPASEAPASEAPASEAPANNGELYEIKWYIGAIAPQPDQQKVLDAFNEKLKEKIPAKLNLIVSDFGSHPQKMQMVIAAQEPFDLCFTSSWNNPYYDNVSKNAFIPLDELLTKAPKLMETIPEAGWNGVKVNGKIYSVPNQQVWASSDGIAVDNRILEETKFDLSTVKDMKDIEPLAKQIMESHSEMYPLEANMKGLLPYDLIDLELDEVSGRNIPGVIKLTDTDLKVYNQFELEEVQNLFKMARDWYQKGYFRKDAATLTDNVADQSAYKNPTCWASNVKPGVEQELAKRFGGDGVTVQQISDAYLRTGGIIATLTAISNTSQNPELVMQFLELINTDPELYNLLCYGIEGTHYNKNADGTIKQIEDSGYTPGIDWVFGNQFNAYVTEGKSPTVWEETSELNKTAKQSPALGFSFNPEPVKAEIAAIQVVLDQYYPALATGSVDYDKMYPEFISKLESAGSQKVIAEVQTQVDEWAKNKG